MPRLNILLDYLFHFLSYSFSSCSSPSLSSSVPFTPFWFHLLFSISEMKASPQLFLLLLKRPKWGSLSDEYPSLFREVPHTHTDFGIYTLLILPCTLNTNTFRWRNVQEVFEVHNSTKYTSTEWENTHADLHMVCLEAGQSLARDPGAWHLGEGCLASGPWR